MSLNTASAALVHYKELIAILKRVKEAATQPDKLLNEEDDKEDNTSSNKEALDEDFNLLTCSYINDALSLHSENSPLKSNTDYQDGKEKSYTQ